MKPRRIWRWVALAAVLPVLGLAFVRPSNDRDRSPEIERGVVMRNVVVARRAILDVPDLDPVAVKKGAREYALIRGSVPLSDQLSQLGEPVEDHRRKHQG